MSESDLHPTTEGHTLGPDEGLVEVEGDEGVVKLVTEVELEGAGHGVGGIRVVVKGQQLRLSRLS